MVASSTPSFAHASASKTVNVYMYPRTLSAAGTTVVPATDKCVTWMGRIYNTTATTVVSFDWACVSMSITLTGSGQVSATFDGRGNEFAVTQTKSDGSAPTVTVPRFSTTHGAATYDLGTVDGTTDGSDVTLTLTKISEEQEDTLAQAAGPSLAAGVCLGALWAAGAGVYTAAKRRRNTRAACKEQRALVAAVPHAAVIAQPHGDGLDQLRQPLSPSGGGGSSSSSSSFDEADPRHVVVGIPVLGGNVAEHRDVPIPIAAAAGPGAACREHQPNARTACAALARTRARRPYCGGRVRSWCWYFFLCLLAGSFLGGLVGGVLRAVGLRRGYRRGLAALQLGAPSPAGVAFESLTLGPGLAVAAKGQAPDGRAHYGARRIEFVGDSDSNGYCIDGTPDMPWGDYFKLPSFQDCSSGYAAQLGRRLGADAHVEAVSGTGVYENGFGISGPIMPALYERTLSSDGSAATAWDWGRWAPGAVVVYLGSNDYANLFGPSDSEFTGAYTTLLQAIGDRYGSDKGGPVEIINICGGPGDARPEPCPLISAVSNKFAHAYATSHYIAIPASLGAGESGCLGHRNLKAQTELADFLEPQIRAITGWAKQNEE